MSSRCTLFLEATRASGCWLLNLQPRLCFVLFVCTVPQVTTPVYTSKNKYLFVFSLCKTPKCQTFLAFQRHYNFRVLTLLHTGSLLFSPACFKMILARVYIYRYELALEPMFDVVLILHLD